MTHPTRNRLQRLNPIERYERLGTDLDGIVCFYIVAFWVVWWRMM